MPSNQGTWTVMVYLAGDNSLTTECLFALTEMKKANPGNDIRVIAQLDPRDERLPTQRYEINRKGANSTLFDDIFDQAKFDPQTGEVHFKRESANAKALATIRAAGRNLRSESLAEANLESSSDLDQVITDDTDTGSPITLYNFISLCLEKYPADHYMVVLSGHAGGTQRDYLLKDESSSGSLTFNELKQVFKRIKADRKGELIDIVGMDNCQMSMVEVCYELRGLAQVVVGCESYSPASGWPYRQILDRLQTTIRGNSNRQKSLVASVARGVVDEYVNYYSPYWLSGMSVSQSAMDLSKVAQLRRLIDKFAQAMESELIKEHHQRPRRSRRGVSHPFKDALVLAHWSAQSYNGELYADLYDFCDCLLQRVASGPVSRAAREVMKFVKSEFVLKSCYSGAAYQYSHGVSLYFPWAQVAADYENLDFSRDSKGSGWLSFLRTYVLLTRRPPRDLDRKTKLGESSIASLNLLSPADRMADDRMADDRMADDRMADDRMADDRMADDRMADDRMADDRMADDRMADDRMNSDKATGNPIHSMRNPPVIFFPTACIKHGRKVLASEERLYLSNQVK
ncbi:MAG TPA: clostripain-related cysteine peptidase [Pyrinomonadaceae bacterium]|nr:clostripain-related cysteine peptidase [Pyrinomonadaceae bacterium]